MGFQSNVTIYRQLTAKQRDILEILAYLQKDGSWAFPSRAYIAEHVGCSVDYVSRTTTKLQDLGIIKKVQRRFRRADGTWDTHSCLYRIIPAFLWIVNSAIQKMKKLCAGLSSRAGRPKDKEKIASAKTEKSLFHSRKDDPDPTPAQLAGLPPWLQGFAAAGKVPRYGE